MLWQSWLSLYHVTGASIANMICAKVVELCIEAKILHNITSVHFGLGALSEMCTLSGWLPEHYRSMPYSQLVELQGLRDSIVGLKVFCHPRDALQVAQNMNL